MKSELKSSKYELMSMQEAYHLQTNKTEQDRPFWNEEMETMPRDKIRDLQEEKLLRIVKRAYQTPFYQRKFQESGITPTDIKSIEDIKKLPFTTKNEIRNSQAIHPPFGDYLTLPFDQISGIYASSGSTGQPTVALLSLKDQEVLTERSARGMWAWGIRPGDVLQNILNPQLFLGYWFSHWGANRVGASVISMGVGSSERQLEVMKRYGVTFLFVTPSYSFHLAEIAAKKGIDVKNDLKVRCLAVGGEPGGSDPNIRRKMEEEWGAKVFDCPGMQESNGWGYACSEQNGVHMNEDHFIWEVLDPETKEPVQPGERGVLVLTTLEVDAQPLIRWWTDDYVVYSEEYCKCGRTFRILPKGVLSRNDDMLKISGVRIWPAGIESVLKQISGFGGEFRIIKDETSVVKETGQLRKLKLEVEYADHVNIESFKNTIITKIKNQFNITPEIVLVGTGTLERFEHKAKRIISRL